MYTLRPYQARAVEQGLAYFNSKKYTTKDRPVIVAPTGAGKSLLVAYMAKELQRGVLVLQPTKELLEQNYGKFTDYGGQASIYSASMGVKEVSKGVTFATIGSIVRRAELFQHIKYVVIDECHLVPPGKSSMYQRFFSEIDAKILGLTATPFRLKNFRDPFTGMPYSQINLLQRMKPRVFTDIIDVTQISEMYEEGFLTPIEYVPLEWGEGKLKVNSTGAEYTDESMREAIKEQKVLERVPEIAERMLAKVCNHVLVFTTSIENAEFLNESSNMQSAVVHSKMKKKDREQVLIDFKAGKIKVIYNVGVLTTGFDFPELDGIILARPTLSLALYMQMIGRGVRLSPGKEKCTVTDMCGNYTRFGAIEELRYEKDYRGLWELKKSDQVLNNKPIV